MVTEIVIQVGELTLTGRLTDEHAPETARRVLAALPLNANARKWGDEVYFEIPVEAGPENARSVVAKGDLGYWPDGRCFCIFYGRTPLSTSDEDIVPASPVNLIGRIDQPDLLRACGEGDQVVVRLAQEGA